MPTKTFRADHLELRHRTYYAVLTVPKDVRHIIGKSKFFKTTGTTDLRVARLEAEGLVIQWLSEISNARLETDDPILKSAVELNKIRSSTPKPVFEEVLDEEVNRVEQLSNPKTAEIFRDIATGKLLLLTSFIEGWEEFQVNKGLTQKNIDQMRRDLVLLTDSLPSTSLLDKKRCLDWIRAAVPKHGLSGSSVTRIISACNNFYAYLQHIQIFEDDAPSPFSVPTAYQVSDRPNAKALFKKQSWKAFSKEQVEKIYAAALDKGDEELADLIALASYTGARIEELCSLLKSSVDLEAMTISINDAKTQAGVRTIPIHPNIQSLLDHLKSTSSNDYIFCNLKPSKYKVRSNAIGKRFGRLKKASGYDKLFVFHSIRKTFTTQMQQAGIAEYITADIVGHELNTMTYGLYSDGTSVNQRREAIEVLNFDFPNLEKRETLEKFFV